MPDRIGLTVRLAVLALVVLATGIALALPAADTKSADAGERATLVDDDGGRPLFTVPALGPGQQFVRCIQLTYRGTGDAQLRLTGVVGGTGLGDKLRLTVERGYGGGYGSCDGFRGAAIYDGTLAGLPGRTVPAQQAGDGDRTTYRFIVTAAPDLQTDLLTASATFTWQATGSSPPPSDDDPPATPPATPPAADPANPATTPAPGDAKAEPPAEAADPAADPKKHAKARGGDPAGDRVRPDAGGRGDAPGSSGSKNKGSDSSVAEQLRRALAAIAATAAEGAKRAAFPMLLLVLMALFVLAQHRLDSRDPKLALAPVHAEPDLPFDDLGVAPISAGRTSLP